MSNLLAAARGNKKLSAVVLCVVAAILDQVFGTDLLGSVLPSLLGL